MTEIEKLKAELVIVTNERDGYRFHYNRTMAVLYHVFSQHPLVNKWNLVLEDVLEAEAELAIKDLPAPPARLHFSLKDPPMPSKAGYNKVGCDLVVTYLFGDALRVVERKEVDGG